MNNLKTNLMMSALLIVLIGTFIFSCSVKAPEVNITGEKTALENQVIGTYQQIEEDVWTLASVRSVGSKQKVTMSAEKKRVLEAVQGRKFNKDDIEEFLQKGIVGENSQGLLEIRDNSKIEKDTELQNRVTKIVESENNYRRVIMDRIMLLNEQAADAGDETVANIFAGINQDNAAPGSWIQTDGDKWIKKGQVNK